MAGYAPDRKMLAVKMVFVRFFEGRGGR